MPTRWTRLWGCWPKAWVWNLDLGGLSLESARACAADPPPAGRAHERLPWKPLVSNNNKSMSMMNCVRTIIEEAAAAQGFRAVRGVVLEIGELAAVDVDALRFSLEAIRGADHAGKDAGR